jgi:predicted glutamine amidotransferase
MCKLFMIAGITNETRNKAWELTIEMAGIMGETMRDGIGYAAVTESGELFGERWHKSEEAFDVRGEVIQETQVEKRIKSSFGKALTMREKPKRYNSFGDEFSCIEDLCDTTAAITLHGRFATSSREFKNTHPFIVDDTSLVHNGVIRNADKLNRMKQSTCDSEVILNLYNEKQVSRWASNIQGVVDELRGYFACGVFTRDADGNRVMDIFKDDTAQLFAAYIEELSTIVFVTNVSDLELACEIADLKIGSVFKVEAGNLIRLNPVTGVVTSITDFDHSPASQQVISTWAAMRDRGNQDVDSDGFAVDLDKVLGL